MTKKAKVKHSALLDSDVARNIRQALKLDNDVPDEHVGVDVSNGLTTLEGVVATDLQREVAEAECQESERRAGCGEPDRVAINVDKNYLLIKVIAPIEIPQRVRQVWNEMSGQST